MAGDVSIATAVNRDAEAGVVAHSADVSRIDQCRASRVNLGHEGIKDAAIKRLVQARERAETIAVREEGFGGVGITRDVGIPGAVHRDGTAVVSGAAANISRIDERRTRSIDLCYKGTLGPPLKVLSSPKTRPSGKVPSLVCVKPVM